MRIIITILVLFIYSFAGAQENSVSDTIPEEKEDSFQLYLSASYTAQQFVETVASTAGVSIGIVYKNRLETNIYYSGILNDFKKQIIFPILFAYEQSNIGIQLQYIFTDKKIRPLVGVNPQYSQLTWRSEGDLDDEFTDDIFIYNIYLGGVWSISKLIGLQTNIGYSFPGKVELVGLEDADFQGFRFDLAIKIGVFSF